MITTKNIQLTRKELFLITIIRHFKKRWWLFISIWILAIFILLNEQFDYLGKFAIVFAILLPIITIIEFWIFAASKDNKLLFLDRYYEIDSEKINGIIDHDSNSLIKIKYFIKAELIRDAYLLFVSKNMFIYIPIKAFKSDLDKLWFENKIIKKIKDN